MITAKQAANIFSKRFPSLKIMECRELPEYWLFTAVENPDEPDYNDPFYAIGKNDGKMYSYSPFDDIDDFNNAETVDFE